MEREGFVRFAATHLAASGSMDMCREKMLNVFIAETIERHRLLWLYVTQKTDLFDGRPKRMLHIAPERAFESTLRQRLGNNYLTADLFDPRAMVKMDISNIEYPDQSFDVIYCSHVLAFVQDDRKAMREFFRVLKTNGWAILLESIRFQKTLEAPANLGPQERLKLLHHAEMVRAYGPDFVDRLREAGFIVETTKVNDLVTNCEAVRMGLRPVTREIYYCTKQCIGGLQRLSQFPDPSCT